MVWPAKEPISSLESSSLRPEGAFSVGAQEKVNENTSFCTDWNKQAEREVGKPQRKLVKIATVFLPWSWHRNYHQRRIMVIRTRHRRACSGVLSKSSISIHSQEFRGHSSAVLRQLSYGLWILDTLQWCTPSWSMLLFPESWLSPRHLMTPLTLGGKHNSQLSLLPAAVIQPDFPKRACSIWSLQRRLHLQAVWCSCSSALIHPCQVCRHWRKGLYQMPSLQGFQAKGIGRTRQGEGRKPTSY